LVRNAYAADQIAVAKPKTLTVLALGEKSPDEYRLSPQELYELGKRLFDKGDLDQAAVHLEDLLQNWNIKLDFYKETARMLLDVYLAQGPPAKVVKYFEIVIEKYPELEIPFAKLMQVGDAYHQIGEYERSYLVFRATVEGSFLRESQVAGFLEEREEFLRSVDVMASLLREYPSEAYVATATYALAQRVYAKAPQAGEDAKLREKKITRVDLIRRALAMLDRFLTEQPQDPAADQASFSLASALLDLDAFQDAIAACRRYAERFPKSEYLDSYWYIIGYCHFARGEHQEALTMCRKVAEARRRNPQTGREEESPNKWQAIYILGQIFHSLGRAADAIDEYTRVKDRFVDARQAIEYFARKDIELPEVSTFRPGEPVQVDLKYRNVKSCDTKVYRIDLMKFSLLKRNLGGITQINLAGIRPYHEATIELGDGKDYRDKETELPLPLKDEGAYLVVCRGENLHASGLVLVSPLELQVQEDTASGRVRTTVRDALADKYVPEVHVKVIGSRNTDFNSGDTDLRGVFVADGIRGATTVIAQTAKSRFAFHRGETQLGAAQQERGEAQSDEQSAQPAPATESDAKQQLLEGLQKGNLKIQMEQQKNLDDVYKNRVKGGVKSFKW
jgi:tetratricopeptide (TPR) repeat protein